MPIRERRCLTCAVLPVSRPKGFTLIELLVVISILGILAALIMANFNAARERARDVQRKSDLDQIKKTLRLYYNNDSQYPSHDSNQIEGCGTTSSPTACSWGVAWEQTVNGGSARLYMKLLPQDPNYDSDSGTPTYNYQVYGSDQQDFCLWASLENTSDADITRSQSRCGPVCSGLFTPETDYTVCAD